MDDVVTITMGLGLAISAGMRSFLPPLLVGLLASANIGIDFDGTSWAFLENPPFLAAVFALNVAAFAAERAGAGPQPGRIGAADVAFGLASGALGGMLFAGVMAEGHEPVVAGLVAGVAIALLTFALLGDVVAGARRRADAEAARFIALFSEAAALVVAGLAVLWGPLSVLVAGGLGWLAISRRRRADRKYAGLRILRD